MSLQDYRSVEQFVTSCELTAARYHVFAVREGEQDRHLVSLELPRPDEGESRHVPSVELATAFEKGLAQVDRRRVINALVRGGIRHPGLRDEDLWVLHRQAADATHIELFTDLNAISTGLLRHVVHSLGRAVARVVIASASIDILHEYQSALKPNSKRFLHRAEMGRALRVLDELREIVPVHVHQLPPGAARYFRRASAEPARDGDPDGEETSYIAEDRQMIAAYWDYLTTSTPRVPIRLVTSDFSLATVCAAERVPFLFAKNPFELWGRSSDAQDISAPESLWYDPFALCLRACTAHALMWELALVYGRLDIHAEPHPNGTGAATDSSFCLRYDARAQRPGAPARLVHASLVAPASSVSVPAPRGDASGPLSPRILKLSLQAVTRVLPTRKGQRVPLSSAELKSADSLRMLRQVGEATGLFEIDGQDVTAGEALSELIAALSRKDYIAVNAIFRRHPSYGDLLSSVGKGEDFPQGKRAGALVGWAVVLGAAFKTQDHGVRYGLADVDDARFEEAVVRVHGEIGRGHQAVPLPNVLRRVCLLLQLSPIRFEAMLERSLGTGALRTYEAQRAKVDVPIPLHPVMIAPDTASPDSYLRRFEPGKGLMLHGRLVGSLVRRADQR